MSEEKSREQSMAELVQVLAESSAQAKRLRDQLAYVEDQARKAQAELSEIASQILKENENDAE